MDDGHGVLFVLSLHAPATGEANDRTIKDTCVQRREWTTAHPFPSRPRPPSPHRQSPLPFLSHLPLDASALPGARLLTALR
jgi:hypothetical protein